jgi:integrase/recombinase XerD
LSSAVSLCTVRVSRATAEILRRLRSATATDAHAPIFPVRNAQGPLDASQAWRTIRAAAKRAGIEKPVSPHFMRHPHANHALERGANVALVKEALGHANLDTTRRYIHARPGESSGLVLPV